MSSSATQQKIDVIDSSEYVRNLKKLPPSADQDVKTILEKEVIPAVLSNPALPHTQGGGTPIQHGIFSKRVPNSSSAAGKSGGFRLEYHWDRQKNRITKLRLELRRDKSTSAASKAIDKLLKEISG